MVTKPTYYTLVRHSGWTFGGKAEFASAVEEQSVETQIAKKLVGKNVVLYNNYSDAREAAMATNYPPGASGLIPRASGKFVNVDGVEYYVNG